MKNIYKKTFRRNAPTFRNVCFFFFLRYAVVYMWKKQIKKCITHNLFDLFFYIHFICIFCASVTCHVYVYYLFKFVWTCIGFYPLFLCFVLGVCATYYLQDAHGKSIVIRLVQETDSFAGVGVTVGCIDRVTKRQSMRSTDHFPMILTSLHGKLVESFVPVQRGGTHS